MKKTIKEIRLEDVVHAFGEVYFALGKFANVENDEGASLRLGLEEYTGIKRAYGKDTKIYDDEINSSLDTFPELDNMPRV